MNCLLATLIAKKRIGGKIRYRPGWHLHWSLWIFNPWGHFYLQVGKHDLHFNALDTSLNPLRQLWFDGKFVRKIAKKASDENDHYV